MQYTTQCTIYDAVTVWHFAWYYLR